MRVAPRPLVALVALVGSALLIGCGGSGSNRHPVSGTVTFKGKALAQGTIQFLPQAKQNTQGLAPITNGAYEVGGGLEPGPYKVVISSADSKSKEEPLPGESGEPGAEKIPAEFNVKSKVVKEVAAGKNQFDFTIP